MRDEELSGAAFRQLAESAPDALAVHRNGVIIWANAAAGELLELPNGKLIGRTVAEFVDPLERDAVQASMAAALRATYVTRFLTHAGNSVEVEVTRIPIGDDLVLVISRSLERERRHRVAEARARAFFDASTTALGISRAGVHLEANLAYARLFGFEDPAQLVGTPILDLIDPSDHQRVRENVRRRVAGEPTEDAYDVLARRRDGSTFLLHVKASSYVDRREVNTIVVMSDVSAERAEAGQRAHRERLEAIGRLAGGVAHDFNNLLAAILANTELTLLEAPAGTSMHENLSTIREATQRAKELVRQILTFGRRDQPRPQPIDGVQVITEALTLARAALPGTVTVSASLAPVEGTVLADPTQLHQVVLNLVSNARDAAPNGRIEVSTCEVDGPSLRPPLAGRWLRLRVRDDGVGMSPETRQRLFEPYHTTKATRGGHGLGLAVVQGIVTALSGRIDVDSQLGQGATFDVLLPLTSAARTVRFTPAPAPAGQGRILVVDDEPMLLRSMAKVVRSLGYEVIEASSGAQALEVLGRSKVDLLLSDVTMPEMSGVELARRVALEYPSVRIVLSSGYSDGLDTHPPGVKALLPKPVGRKQLALALSVAFVDPA